MLAIAKRRFWLARRYVNDPAVDKARLIPPADVVYLDGELSESLPRVEAEDVRHSSIGQPQIFSELWTPRPGPANSAYSTRPIFRFADVVLPDRHCALIVDYEAAAPAEIAYSATGSAGEQDRCLRPV